MFTATGQTILPLIPQPQDVQLGVGAFFLSPNTAIVTADSALQKQVVLFNDYLKKLLNFELRVRDNVPESIKSIRLSIKKDPAKPEGSYHMQVLTTAIVIEGNDATGVFYGLNNLLQFSSTAKNIGLPGFKIPVMQITDAPRFDYRGMMLDVSRHFRSVDFIKLHIDRMAMLKLNVFHWHLTDDQGWRIEIKKYPKLTEIGAWRDGTIMGSYPGKGNDNLKHGGFYTQEQVKEIVQYAADRHITVIPEIEMPGHSSAAIAAYPWLSCFPDEETNIHLYPSDASNIKKGKKVQETFGVFEDVFAPTEQTFSFLQDVMDEIIPLFPGKYIHIGGDECPKEAWKKSAFCQQLIKEKELKDEHGLQSYFIQRMEKYINSKGKQIIGWDEILEGGLAPKATVMSWRGEEGGIDAAKQNHDVIMSPTTYVYLDYSQTKNEDSVVIGGFLPLEKVYGYDPMPEALKNTPFAKYVKGAQGNVWTEYMREDSKLEYMIFPRLAALSEALWTMPEHKSWENFQQKLPIFFRTLDKLGINYSKAFYEIETAIVPNENKDGVVWQLNTTIPDATIYVTSPDNTQPTKYNYPVDIKQGGLYKAFMRKDGKDEKMVKQTFTLHNATGRDISLAQPPAQKYTGNGGIHGLVNGAISNDGLKSAEWVGWEGGDMVAVIDLGNSREINNVNIYVLESKGSWIYRPSDLKVFVSEDNLNFILVGTGKKEELSAIELPRLLHTNLQQQNNTTIKGRYVKIILNNFGVIPAGMPGAGHKAWLFVDEIEIN